MDIEEILRLIAQSRQPDLLGGALSGMPLKMQEDDTGRQIGDTNYLQDILQLLEDPLLAGMAGNGFDPMTFAPTAGEGETLEVPSDPLAPYLGLGAETLEGSIAAALAQNASPSQAADAAIEAFGLDEKRAEAVRTQAQQMFEGRASYRSEMQAIPGMVENPEVGGFEYQGPGQFDGRRIVLPGESEIASQFSERGLSSPFDQFTAEDFQGQELMDARSAAEEAQRSHESLLAGFEDQDARGARGEEMRQNALSALQDMFSEETAEQVATPYVSGRRPVGAGNGMQEQLLSGPEAPLHEAISAFERAKLGTMLPSEREGAQTFAGRAQSAVNEASKAPGTSLRPTMGASDAFIRSQLGKAAAMTPMGRDSDWRDQHKRSLRTLNQSNRGLRDQEIIGGIRSNVAAANNDTPYRRETDSRAALLRMLLG